MILIKKDISINSSIELLRCKSFHDNGDGSVSLLMPDGTFAYQEPTLEGIFGFSPTPLGAYQQAKINGQLITFWTRAQDPPYVYTWAEFLDR